MKRYKWNNKLTAYSAMAVALLASSKTTEAQLVYTDLDPDVALDEGDDEYNWFDLNADSIIDIGIYYTTFDGCGYCPTQIFMPLYLANDNLIATAIAPGIYLYDVYGSTCYFESQALPQIFEDGDTIFAETDWNNVDKIFDSLMCGYPYGDDYLQGFFKLSYESTDGQFLGLKLINEIDTSYCWLRLRWEDGDLFAKDYACQNSLPLVINDLIPDKVENVTLVDDTCTATTASLLLSFDRIEDESTISNYRVFLSTWSASEEEGLAVAPANYIEINPTGSDISMHFPPEFHNMYGATIYSTSNVRANVMSIPSITYVEPAIATSASANFANDYAGAEDIYFLSPTDVEYPLGINIHVNGVESDVLLTEYRIMLLKNTDVSSFTIEDAQSAAEGNYMSFPGSDNYINTHWTADAVAWNGEPLLPYTEYKAAVLSINNPKSGCTDDLDLTNNTVQIHSVVSIEEFSGTDVEINYSQGILSIHLSKNMPSIVSVTNISGQIIYYKNHNEADFEILLNEPAGVYIIKIQNGNTQVVKKIIVD